MRLADFILTHREAILVEWAAFARTCAPPSGTMDIRALRDHAGPPSFNADRIVAAHDGRIEVKSTEASGTTFTVCLPMQNATDQITA